jgi:hypothetical protein
VYREWLPRPDAIGKCGFRVVFCIYSYSSLACLYGFTHCNSSMVIDIDDVCTRISGISHIIEQVFGTVLTSLSAHILVYF